MRTIFVMMTIMGVLTTANNVQCDVIPFVNAGFEDPLLVDDDFPVLAGFHGYRIELLAGDTVIAVDDNSLEIEEGSFGISTINYKSEASNPQFGLPLTIRLINLLNAPGSEVDFDDLVLTAESALPCPWDLEGSGSVDTSDLLNLFAQWGTDAPADFDKSGAVNTNDLLILFANWGPCP